MSSVLREANSDVPGLVQELYLLLSAVSRILGGQYWAQRANKVGTLSMVRAFISGNPSSK